MEKNNYLNLAEATKFLENKTGIKSTQTVAKFIKTGQLKALIFGGSGNGKRYKIKKSWIDKLIKDLSN